MVLSGEQQVILNQLNRNVIDTLDWLAFWRTFDMAADAAFKSGELAPLRDGQGFLESQLEDPALVGVPVVLVTAQNADRALRYSTVRGVVPKPLELPALLTLIDQLIQSP